MRIKGITLVFMIFFLTSGIAHAGVLDWITLPSDVADYNSCVQWMQSNQERLAYEVCVRVAGNSIYARLGCKAGGFIVSNYVGQDAICKFCKEHYPNGNTQGNQNENLYAGGNKPSNIVPIADDCEGNCDNGRGKGPWNNGMYIGTWRKSMPHGRGILYSFYTDKENNSVKYKGLWREGQYHGAGTSYYDHGNKQYSGGWSKGKKHGRGTIYSEEGRVSFRGRFKEGQYAGHGSEYDKKGKLIYRGNFENNLYSGKGRLYEDGRLKYAGNFEQGQRSGKGTSYYPNRRREYYGQWSGDLFHGTGTLYAENGRVEYRGKFMYGQRETEPAATIAENKPREEQSQRNNYARNRANRNGNRSNRAAPTNAWRYWSIFPIAEWGVESRYFNDDVINKLMKKKSLTFVTIGLFRFNYNNFGMDLFLGFPIKQYEVQGIVYRHEEGSNYEVYNTNPDEMGFEASMCSFGLRVAYNVPLGRNFSLYVGGGLEYFTFKREIRDHSPDFTLSESYVDAFGGVPDDWVDIRDAENYSKVNPFLSLGMQLKFSAIVLRGDVRVSPLYTSFGGSVGIVLNW